MLATPQGYSRWVLSRAECPTWFDSTPKSCNAYLVSLSSRTGLLEPDEGCDVRVVTAHQHLGHPMLSLPKRRTLQLNLQKVSVYRVYAEDL